MEFRNMTPSSSAAPKSSGRAKIVTCVSFCRRRTVLDYLSPTRIEIVAIRSELYPANRGGLPLMRRGFGILRLGIQKGTITGIFRDDLIIACFPDNNASVAADAGESASVRTPFNCLVRFIHIDDEDTRK